MKAPTVGGIQEKAAALWEEKANDWFYAETVKLANLKDCASEHGHKKEVRKCQEQCDNFINPHCHAIKVHTGIQVAQERQLDVDQDSEISVDLATLNSEKMESKMHATKITLAPVVKTNAKNEAALTVLQENRNKESQDSGSDKYPLGKHKFSLATEVKNQAQGDGCAKEDSATVMRKSDVDKQVTDPLQWYYQDLKERTHGPFSMMQLRKWSKTGVFPSDLRIWRTVPRGESSILLMDALNLQGKEMDFPAVITDAKTAAVGEKAVGMQNKFTLCASKCVNMKMMEQVEKTLESTQYVKDACCSTAVHMPDVMESTTHFLEANMNTSLASKSIGVQELEQVDKTQSDVSNFNFPQQVSQYAREPCCSTTVVHMPDGTQLTSHLREVNANSFWPVYNQPSSNIMKVYSEPSPYLTVWENCHKKCQTPPRPTICETGRMDWLLQKVNEVELPVSTGLFLAKEPEDAALANGNGSPIKIFEDQSLCPPKKRAIETLEDEWCLEREESGKSTKSGLSSPKVERLASGLIDKEERMQPGKTTPTGKQEEYGWDSLRKRGGMQTDNVWACQLASGSVEREERMLPGMSSPTRKQEEDGLDSSRQRGEAETESGWACPTVRNITAANEEETPSGLNYQSNPAQKPETNDTSEDGWNFGEDRRELEPGNGWSSLKSTWPGPSKHLSEEVGSPPRHCGQSDAEKRRCLDEVSSNSAFAGTSREDEEGWKQEGHFTANHKRRRQCVGFENAESGQRLKTFDQCQGLEKTVEFERVPRSSGDERDYVQIRSLEGDAQREDAGCNGFGRRGERQISEDGGCERDDSQTKSFQGHAGNWTEDANCKGFRRRPERHISEDSGCERDYSQTKSFQGCARNWRDGADSNEFGKRPERQFSEDRLLPRNRRFYSRELNVSHKQDKYVSDQSFFSREQNVSLKNARFRNHRSLSGDSDDGLRGGFRERRWVRNRYADKAAGKFSGQGKGRSNPSSCHVERQISPHIVCPIESTTPLQTSEQGWTPPDSPLNSPRRFMSLSENNQELRLSPPLSPYLDLKKSSDPTPRYLSSPKFLPPPAPSYPELPPPPPPSSSPKLPSPPPAPSYSELPPPPPLPANTHHIYHIDDFVASTFRS